MHIFPGIIKRRGREFCVGMASSTPSVSLLSTAHITLIWMTRPVWQRRGRADIQAQQKYQTRLEEALIRKREKVGESSGYGRGILDAGDSTKEISIEFMTRSGNDSFGQERKYFWKSTGDMGFEEAIWENIAGWGREFCVGMASSTPPVSPLSTAHYNIPTYGWRGSRVMETCQRWRDMDNV